MNEYLEYCVAMQAEEYGIDYFARSMDFEYCECGESIKECPNSYEHMSRGY